MMEYWGSRIPLRFLYRLLSWQECNKKHFPLHALSCNKEQGEKGQVSSVTGTLRASCSALVATKHKSLAAARQAAIWALLDPHHPRTRAVEFAEVDALPGSKLKPASLDKYTD